MAILVENLKEAILDNVKASDKIVIVSGYATPDIIEEIAFVGVEMTFYYGMYRMDGITPLLHNKLKALDANYSNLVINIVNDHHVHTKCYLFYKNGYVQSALVGSANCSINGLSSGKNSEMLVELNGNELKNVKYLVDLDFYVREIDAASLHCTNPTIMVKNKISLKKTQNSKKEIVPYSGNPFVAIMPLYTVEKKKRVVQKAGGINWGLQSGHSKKGTGYAEAYIPVFGEHVDKHPIIFPFFPTVRTTTTGKTTRRYDPVTVLWDDGTVMEMIFSGNGVERPTKGKRETDDPYRKYPKNFTSGSDSDGGGAILGEYLRRRMNIPPRKVITINDLKKYKKNHVQLTYISPGFYEADFSGTPLP